MQPVFDAIVRSCRRLFGGKAVPGDAARRHDRGRRLLRRAVTEGVGFLKPWPLDRGSGAGTCILEGREIAVAGTVEGP